MMSSQHCYALVSRPDCPRPVQNKIVVHDDCCDDGKVNVREEVVAIYERYAEMYPNPKLAEEMRQRDVLLQAVRAASTYQHDRHEESSSSSSSSSRTKKKKGFFSFLFGGNQDDDSNKHDDAETMLTYHDTPGPLDDGRLCDTRNSIDVTCIPEEVYGVARCHLTSTRTRRDHPNALRWGPAASSSSSSLSFDTVMFIVMGLGEIAEFHGTAPPCTTSTSDREQLEAYAERTGKCRPHEARGAVLSGNSIAVSWGFQDGVVVVYRRIRVPGYLDGHGWQAVWTLGPSTPVLEAMTAHGRELFHDDAERPGSPLLTVSDCLPLSVDMQQTPPDNHPRVTMTLAVSRLGGYIELVPLPTELWSGSVLTSDRNRTTPERRKRRQHYAMGNNIACPPQTVAWTTGEYHVDVQALEAFRTGVNTQTPWNDQDYPESPPAEFILASSGVSTEGSETITFWTVSTLVPDDAPDPHDEIGFHLHSSLIDVVPIMTGSDVTVFASSGIMNRWRTPRQVELKDMASTRASLPHRNTETPATRVNTLSTSAPVVRMCFSDTDGSTSAHSGPFLSVMDWNGGVQILDCSVMGRAAAQNMPLHEYERYQSSGEEQDPERQPFSLVTDVVSRSHFATSLQKVQSRSVDNMRWIGGCQGVGTDTIMPPLALLVDKSQKLVVMTFDLPEESRNGIASNVSASLDSSLLALRFPASGAAMRGLGDGNLAFVGVQTGKSKSSRQSGRRLRYFVMEQLQPVAIVETLARDSKFQEAVEAANNLPPYEQAELAGVMSHCHKKLWETKRDVLGLEATGEAAYIIQEAMSLLENNNLAGLTLERFHEVFRLALSCGERTKDNQIVGKVREIIVRLGTYELLCRHFGSKPCLRKFRQSFLTVDISRLSVQVAQRGDVSAVSILLFRHRRDIGHHIFDVLSSLPFSLHPDTYSHLIPVIRNGSYSDFFLGIHDGETNIPWSHMPQYLAEAVDTTIVLGLLDEKAVLDHNKGVVGKSDSDSKDLESVAANWVLARAKLGQTFVGNIDGIIRLCDLGLRCCVPEKSHNSMLDHTSSAVQQLYRTWHSAVSLQRMILDEVVAIDGDGVDTEHLMRMSLVELLDLVLHSEADSGRIMYRFREYVQPMMLECSSAGTDDGLKLDEALSSYCVNEAQKCWNSSLPAIKVALGSCVAVAECSKTSLPRQTRLIKQEAILVEMVVRASMQILKALASVSVQTAEQREILGSFWSMYESLPLRVTQSSEDQNAAINTLYTTLVTLDVLSGWPGSRAFPNVVKLHETTNLLRNDSMKSRQNVMDGICQSFLELTGKIANNQNRKLLLRDLVSDLENLNKISFESSVDVATTVCNNVIPDLLSRGSFDLVAELIGLGGSSVDKAQIEQAVLDYVDELTFSENSSEIEISRAIRCQDILGPLLPEAQNSFQSIRRFLDASHFVSTVLFDGRNVKHMHPMDFKNMSGLDAVETVLQSVPESVVCGCPQWMDSVFAINANRTLRDAASAGEMSSSEQSLAEVPVLPGGAVFHLATVLRLEDSKSVLAVKCRVIFYAMESEFYGAAAAIARTLIYEGDFGGSQTTESADLVKLAAIAEVVTAEKYLDLTTKQELCHMALVRFRSTLSPVNCEPFSSILQVSANLDVTTSRFNQAFRELSPERKEVLLSRPLARLYKHIFYEYNSDIFLLFLDLVKQTEHEEVHDALMNALSRFIIYWCIHDSKTLKRIVDVWDKADTMDNLALGCSLLLQIPSKLTATNCVHELQKIAADQAANVSSEERFGASETFCDPNPDIVQRLIGRGYSENAARRAVVMTGNSGYNDALGYAVMHTMDPDFNQPLAILKPANRMYVDEDAIQLLQNSLLQVRRILENPTCRSRFIASISSQHEYKKNDKNSNKISEKNHGKEKAKQLAHPVDKTASRPSPGKINTQSSGRAGKQAVPSLPPQQPRVPRGNGEITAIPDASAGIASIGTMETSTIAPLIPQQKTPKPPVAPVVTSNRAVSLNLQIDTGEVQPAIPKSNGSRLNGRGSTIANAPSVPHQKVVDREELKKQAKANFRSTPTNIDRQKLIEQGRQLLQKARSTGPNIGGTTSTSRPPPPNAKKPVNIATSMTRVGATSITSRPKLPPRNSAKVMKIDAAEDTTTGDDDDGDDGWGFDDI